MFAFVALDTVNNSAMIFFDRIYLLKFTTILTVAAAIASAANFASADVRDDAIIAVSRLHKAGAARHLPDDMKSLDSTLADAEQYNEQADLSGAKKLYMLTLQKAQIIELSLTTPQTSPPDVLPQVTSETIPPVPPTATSPPDVDPVSDVFPEEATSSKLVGGVGTYTVTSGDTIRLVAARLGVTRQHLIKLNRLDTTSYLKIGQKLTYNNRKIIPKRMQDGIVVNIPDRTLYFFQQGKLLKSLPVALGTSVKSPKYVWQTPVGKFKIIAKQKDPTWFIPPSIKSEMEESGKEVISSVPPGPQNPLGKYAMKTSIPGILIHSTTKPWSIYSYASHGCIRVYPADMVNFFKEVKINTPGEIIYKPVKLAITESGRIFLEVHNDVYRKGTNVIEEAKRMILNQNLSDRVDWKKFETVTRQKFGVAEDITM